MTRLQLRSLLIAVLLVFGLLSSHVAKAQVHVGPGQLYKDLGEAAHARAVHPGDTVYLHAGTYTNSVYFIDSLIGTSDKWITIRPWQNDSISIHEQYQVQNAQYVRITGLNFYGNDPTQASRVYHLLQFDYQYNCYSAIHDIIIENCRFTDLNNTGKQGSGAFLKFTGTEGFVVRNCSFINGTNVADGISMNGDENGVISHCTFQNISGNGSHVKGGTKNILYEKNIFIDCITAGVDVGGDTGPQFFCPLKANWEADSIKLYANVFIGGTTGIRLSSCHNSVIANNTCFKMTQFAFRSLNASSNGIYLLNNRIVNNIFTTYSTNHIYVNASAGGDFTTEFVENNLFHDYKYADPSSINFSEIAGAHISGTLIGDPMFADTAHRDFSLKSGSAAIGAGVSLDEPKTDALDHPYSSTARSVGAYEVEQPEAIRELPERSDLAFTLSPNPAATVVTVRLARSGGASVSEIALCDPLGREVLRTPLNESRFGATFDVSHLGSGEYFLLLRSETGAVLAKRAIVKR